MLIIAHRGARATHPENTLAAIQAALDIGAQAIEIDIHEHDGQFWVIHDKWLNRTTNSIGRLNWYRSDKLNQIDAGQGEKIPTLTEVLQLIAGRCALNIEIKGINNFELLYQQLDFALNQCQFQPTQLMLSSFNHAWLQQIKQSQPQWLIGALTASKGIDKALFAKQLGAVSINLDLDVVDDEYIADAKQLGLAVFVYTVNQSEDWHWLATLGVDGIFCDDPAAAIKEFPQASSYFWQ